MRPKNLPDPPPALMDVDALAALLVVSTRHVYRLNDAGRIPAPVKLGNSVRWRRNQILEWIDNGCPPVASRGNRK